MKVLVVVVLFAVFSCASAKSAAEVLAPLVKECNEEIQPDVEALVRLITGDFSQCDQKIKCYTACIFRKFGGWINSTVQEDVLNEILEQFFPHDVIAAAAAKCNHIRGEDDCDSAFKIAQCYYENHSTKLTLLL